MCVHYQAFLFMFHYLTLRKIRQLYRSYEKTPENLAIYSQAAGRKDWHSTTECILEYAVYCTMYCLSIKHMLTQLLCLTHFKIRGNPGFIFQIRCKFFFSLNLKSQSPLPSPKVKLQPMEDQATVSGLNIN